MDSPFAHAFSNILQLGHTRVASRIVLVLRLLHIAGTVFRMVAIKKKRILWYLFRAPLYLYRWRLGRIFGKRLLLLTHTGRRNRLRRHTLLEVVEYRKGGPEVVVVKGFGPDCDCLRNIEAKPGEEVTVGSRRFAAVHRRLSEEQAMHVIQAYEHRKQFIAPIVRAGFSWLRGWRYQRGRK
jgi:deazaflavin-dependent oxidoreductase (nitroreductase family)